jgi:hypothetical protein
VLHQQSPEEYPRRQHVVKWNVCHLPKGNIYCYTSRALMKPFSVRLHDTLQALHTHFCKLEDKRNMGKSISSLLFRFIKWSRFWSADIHEVFANRLRSSSCYTNTMSKKEHAATAESLWWV